MTDRPRLVALVALALVFALALAHLPSTLHAISADHRELASIPLPERPLVGAFSTDIDRAFLEQAKQLIPSRATYYVTTGPGVEVSSQTTLTAIAPYLAYWLMPRVPVADPHRADWIVSYGGTPARLGVELGRQFDVSKGLEVAEVVRP